MRTLKLAALLLSAFLLAGPALAQGGTDQAMKAANDKMEKAMMAGMQSAALPISASPI